MQLGVRLVEVLLEGRIHGVRRLHRRQPGPQLVVALLGRRDPAARGGAAQADRDLQLPARIPWAAVIASDRLQASRYKATYIYVDS